MDPATVRAMCNRLVELGFATNVGNDAASYHRGDDIDIIHTVTNRTELARAQLMSGDSDQLFVQDSIDDLLAEEAQPTLGEK